jgi:hypothetical protein
MYKGRRDMKTYTVPQKEIPVRFSADVVVCGGGTAGVHAAIAAANEGCSVIVIEQFGSVGGSAGNALVSPVMHSHIEGDPACSYITNLLNDRMTTLGGLDSSKRVFDPLILRFASEQLCLEAGVKLLYYNFISGVIKENGIIKGVITVSKSGEYIVEGKEFIDCTGDGDLSVLAGAEYTKGNPETGKCQPISLRYTVSGVDVDELGRFTLNEMSRTGVNKGASYSNGVFYAACTSSDDWTYTDVFKKAITAGDLTDEDKAYWQVFMLPNRSDSLTFNNPEFFEYVDGTDSVHLTQAQIDGKAAILRQMKFYKKYLKGFEKAYVAEVAPMVGVRESRNIVAEYMLTGVDLLSKKKFDDAFCQSNYPVDIHGKSLNFTQSITPVNDGKPWYEIPFRSLVVKGFDNLFVAGRCLGAEFLAQSSLRVQQSARSSGEAAGLGASIAVKENIKAQDIEGRRVRAIMEAKGAVYKK